MKSKSAVILAGGKSSRMMRDKAFLEISGIKLIEIVYKQLEPFFEDIIISVSKNNAEFFSNYKTVIDKREGQGPLMGILSGLLAASNEMVFFVAIDIPRIDRNLLTKIISHAEDNEIVVLKTKEGHFEPLFALYKKSVIPQIKILIDSGIRKIIELYPLCKTKYLIQENGEHIININTPEDYKRYLHSSDT